MPFLQFDHAVLVVDDEERAREFYLDYSGLTLLRTFTRERGRLVHRSFLHSDSGHAIGLFEDRGTVPEPKEVREFTTVVLRVNQNRYDRAKRELDGVEIQSSTPWSDTSFYTHDSEGNPIGFSLSTTQDDSSLLRLELDTPKVDEALAFYEDIFGLQRSNTGFLSGQEGMPYAWLPVGDSGQGILLVERPAAPGANLGHHFAFLVRHAEHSELRENLARRGVQDVPGREGTRGEGELGTYLLDPWGRKLQWITHASTG